MNRFGKIAERQAANFLIKKRYKIVDFNYHSRFGEIDIIAKNKKYLVFVEVKQRKNSDFAQAAEYVDYNKQKKIIATAEIYLANHKTKLQPRFDIIEIYSQDNVIKSIKHLENAFTLV